MTSLAEDMTRLCGEINALRRARGTMMKDLEKAARGRKVAVSELRADFAFVRNAMAHKMKLDLSSFVSALRDKIAEDRRQMGSDLAGVRRAWLAPVIASAEASAPALPIKTTFEEASAPMLSRKRTGRTARDRRG